MRQRQGSCTKPTATAAGATFVAFDGERFWTLDLFQHSEYEAQQQVDPQPVGSLDEARRMAQSWEAELY